MSNAASAPSRIQAGSRGGGSTFTRTYASELPAAWASRIRRPSSTAGGIVTSILRRFQTSPTPTHAGQCAETLRPLPRHSGHGSTLSRRPAPDADTFLQTLRDPTSVSPVLLILLAVAICLLSLAALPRTVVTSPALAEQLTHRRLELALVGTSTLLVVVLAYMIF